MARIEKTVFISYRRTDVYTALAVYENLKNQGYDVFFDYRSISSGDFEQIISVNIRARAHFLLILTPIALDRCNEPGDWLRREIELAMDEKRNIIPLFFKGFRFGAPSVSEKLTGKLKNLSRYNGLNIHEDYFDEAMHRLGSQYLNIPLETVLHPVSTEIQKAVRAEQVAVDKALAQIGEVRGLVGQAEEKTQVEKLTSQAIQYELKGDFWNALQTYYKIKRIDPFFPRVDVKIKELEQEVRPTNMLRLVRSVVMVIVGIALSIWGSSALLNNLPSSTFEPTRTLQPATTNTSLPSQTSILPTPILGIGSTMTSEDGMALLYIPAGEFTMGSNEGDSDEKPVHTVHLDAFWIDKTEVTNAMYAKCVRAGKCDQHLSTGSQTRENYYGNSDFNDYPVIHVSWSDAKAYCAWADRRLPTEAEWEKAAAGENAFTYPWGNDAPNNELLNYNGAVGDTTPVGKYPNGASPYGALDMAGNVSEWVADWYSETYYASLPGSNPLGPDLGQLRVYRGGSWDNHDRYVRSAERGAVDPTSSTNYFGFRCAISEIS